jgi:hypothetical protein
MSLCNEKFMSLCNEKFMSLCNEKFMSLACKGSFHKMKCHVPRLLHTLEWQSGCGLNLGISEQCMYTSKDQTLNPLLGPSFKP